MIENSTQTWEEGGVKVIIHKNTVMWLKMLDIQTRVGVKHMSDLTIKEIEDIYNKKMKSLTKQEIQGYKTWASDGFFCILSNLALKIIMHCGRSKAFKFRFKLRFKQQDIITTKEQSIITKLMTGFAKEEISP